MLTASLASLVITNSLPALIADVQSSTSLCALAKVAVWWAHHGMLSLQVLLHFQAAVPLVRKQLYLSYVCKDRGAVHGAARAIIAH